MIIWVMGILLTALVSEASSTRNQIVYAEEYLTAHLVEANLKDVLLTVATEAELEFVINEAIAAQNVSVWFDKLPLERGIKKILRSFNHSMVFNSSGRLKKVIVIESGSKSTLETISGDHNCSLSIALNQQDSDPSLGPAGRFEEDLPESSAGTLGPEGDMHVPVAGVDFDPALGPSGRPEEALPESATGPEGPEDEMSVFPRGEEFDPSLGPTGQPEKDLRESITGSRGSPQESQGPAPSMAKQPSPSQIVSNFKNTNY